MKEQFGMSPGCGSGASLAALLLLALAVPAAGQVVPLRQASVTQSMDIASGATLTVQSGGTFVAATGSTINLTSGGVQLNGTQVSFSDPGDNFNAANVTSALAELADANASGVNAADGKVHWTQLVGVPAGFADGTDDGGTGGGSGGSLGYPLADNREALALSADATITSSNKPFIFIDPSGGDGDHTLTIGSGDGFVLVHDGAAGRFRVGGAVAAAKGQSITVVYDGTEYHISGPQEEVIALAASDESTALTAGPAKVTWRAPFGFFITRVRASLTTASSSGAVTVDINENGTSVLSTKLSIDATEKTSTTAASSAVISDPLLTDDAEVTVDIDAAGTGASGLKVVLYGVRM